MGLASFWCRAAPSPLSLSQLYSELPQDVNKAMLKIQQRYSPHEGEYVAERVAQTVTEMPHICQSICKSHSSKSSHSPQRPKMETLSVFPKQTQKFHIQKWLGNKCLTARVTSQTRPFFVNEDIKLIDIHERLQAQYGDETLYRSRTFEWR